MPNATNQTPSKTFKTTYVVRNYPKFASSKNFPKFKLPSNEEYEFFVSFHPDRKCSFYNANYTTILLALNSRNTPQITVRYQISLLNSNRDKCWPQDGIADVSNKTSNDAYFGHYQILRSNILDPANGLLVDDELRIYCEIEELDVKSQAIDRLAKIGTNLVLKNYECLLESAKFSDATLIIGDDKLPVHKAILGAQSKVFAAMFEHDCKEKRQNRIEITDISVDVCKQMLRYIYTGQIVEMDPYAEELLFAADKYQLDHLKEACEEHLGTSIDTETVANTLLVADMHSASLLKTQCIEFVIEHGKDVIASEGWKMLTKARPELVIQLFEQIYNQM